MAGTKAYPKLPTPMQRESLIKYYKDCVRRYKAANNSQEYFMELDKAYLREGDRTADTRDARAANRAGDVSRYQNMIVPIVHPTVESTVEYLTSVFLTGDPLFAVIASAKYQDAAMQLETVMDRHAKLGGWVQQLMMNFRAGAKYNIAITDLSWKEIKSNKITPNSKGEGISVVEATTGINSLRNIDPYNAFWDPSVAPYDVSSLGEFAGYHELYSNHRLREYLTSINAPNAKEAYESKAGVNLGEGNSTDTSPRYYVPEVNPRALFKTSKVTEAFDWGVWMELEEPEQRKLMSGHYEVTTLYVRIVPSDFGFNQVPKPNTPQIFKLGIVNHSVLVEFTPVEAAHGKFPMLVTQLELDNLGIQTKSLADTVIPMQDIGTALLTSSMDARRRAIGDRLFYDANLISPGHINSANPTARIPVRAGINRRIQDAVMALPFNDNISQNALQEIRDITGMAYTATGQNPARQGQFSKGNRTRHEYQDIMSNANGRDQMRAILCESQQFTPLKEMAKSNILQYQGADFLLNSSKRQVVEIKPDELRDAVMEFQVSDGLVPADKLGNAETYQVAMQVMGSSPAIGQGYDVGGMFSYLMKMQGAKELDTFKKPQELMMYEQALQSWQMTAQQLSKSGQPVPPQPKPADFWLNPDGTPFSDEQKAAVKEANNKKPPEANPPQ